MGYWSRFKRKFRKTTRKTKNSVLKVGRFSKKAAPYVGLALQAFPATQSIGSGILQISQQMQDSERYFNRGKFTSKMKTPSLSGWAKRGTREHLLGSPRSKNSSKTSHWSGSKRYSGNGINPLALFRSTKQNESSKDQKSNKIIMYVVGGIAGLALMVFAFFKPKKRRR